MLIYGLDDTDDSTYKTVADFLYTYLDLEAEELYIEDCERLGTLRNNRFGVYPRAGQKRPVLVTFRYPQEVNTCIRNAYKLACTRFAIDRDTPLEITLARKKLWPEIKNIRKQDGKPKVTLKFPSAKEVNGQIVRDEFPGWKTCLKGVISVNNGTSLVHRSQSISVHDQAQNSIKSTTLADRVPEKQIETVSVASQTGGSISRSENGSQTVTLPRPEPEPPEQTTSVKNNR